MRAGENILGSGFDLELHVHRSAGRYILGEETALLASSRATQVSFERREGDLSIMTYCLWQQLATGGPDNQQGGTHAVTQCKHGQCPGQVITALAGIDQRPDQHLARQRTIGRDHEISDGDVVEFLFSG